MFYKSESKENNEKYINLLKRIGSLSKLFSDSEVPDLYYRAAENIFCLSFGAENHSRSDTAIDASKNGIGVGIKTFVHKNGKTFQKIAEFNKKSQEYIHLKDNPEKLVAHISELRNTRLEFAQATYNIDNFIYHCILREPKKFLIYEEEMNPVDIRNINITSVSDKKIDFSDGISEYKFNYSKSTLLKRFITQSPLDFDVQILEDPFTYLENLEGLPIGVLEYEKVYLPLYSEEKGIKYVAEKSGLNQWNAGGRTRKNKEVYIKIPLWIHRAFPNFFPSVGHLIQLKLPNGKVLRASLCQQGGKALMSNPNTHLGDWLIDDVLKIQPGNIVTYDLLTRINSDTIEVRKTGEDFYEIDFKKVGTFEKFEAENKVQKGSV